MPVETDDRVADPNAGGLAEPKRRQRLRPLLDLEHRHVGRLVHADDPGLHALAIREADADLAAVRVDVLDDVVVRHDVARLVQHEAGAEPLAALLLGEAEAEEGIGDDAVDDAGGVHLDDAGLGALVDLVDRHRLAFDRRLAGREDVVHDGRRARALVVEEERVAGERQHGSDEPRADQCADTQDEVASAHIQGYSRVSRPAERGAVKRRLQLC
jgi:hypothetical protein